VLRVMSAAEIEALRRMEAAARELARCELEFQAVQERETYRARRDGRLRLVYSARQSRRRTERVRQGEGVGVGAD
jgi:hypothetical protein